MLQSRHLRNTVTGLAMAAAAVLAGTATASACDRGAEVCSFRLINNTGVELYSFWASPSRVSSWENDILGDDTLGAGRAVNVNLSDGRRDCVYDFKFKFSDGDIVERRQINICRLGRYTLNER
ncbi:hypothetical protein BN1110_05264 [bacterium YEK0313]|nr:hypothetical protein BN1110_05264 [bacterium YEK0313]